MKIRKEEHQIIINYRNKGLTYEAIGKIYGVTRQRIGQILKNIDKKLDKKKSIN